MRPYKESPYGNIVDLDDPSLYSHLPDNIKLLDDLMFKEIGYALCYMDYFHKDSYCIGTKWESCLEQRKSINKLIEKFTSERRNHYEDVMWYKEQIFLFKDEIENMC